jgi:hypothetical protein
VVWVNAAHKLDSAREWSVTVYAAGQCHPAGRAAAGRRAPAASAPAAGVAGTGPELKCRAPQATTANITGRAPAVGGHRALWAGPELVWQYARDGWATLILPDVRPSPQLAADRRVAGHIASQVRYGAATPPLLFPVQLTSLPSRWQVSSLTYVPDARVLRATSVALGAGPPNLGADGGLVFETGLPYFTMAPATRSTGNCSAHRGSVRETINGHRVVVTEQPFGRLDLCASNVDGFWMYISEFGKHPLFSTAGLFGHHMRLLGRHPANWTPNPIG